MMLRSLAVAALTLAGSGVACAQSVYLYVAPGASVYVTPTPNGPYYNGAPAVYPGPYPEPYAPPAPVVAAPLSPSYPAEVVAAAVYAGTARRWRPMARHPASCSGASMSRSRRGRRRRWRMAGGAGGRALDALASGVVTAASCRATAIGTTVKPGKLELLDIDDTFCAAQPCILERA